MTVNVASGIGSQLWIAIVAPCTGRRIGRELSCRQGFIVRKNAAVIEKSRTWFSFISGL
jgi:hypothetical protein